MSEKVVEAVTKEDKVGPFLRRKNILSVVKCFEFIIVSHVVPFELSMIFF